MLSIRNSTFETNSSSAHTITFSTNTPKIIFPRRLKLQGGCWGTEVHKYSDPQSKFSYWFNAFIQNIHQELLAEAASKAGLEMHQFLFGGNKPLDQNVCTSILFLASERLRIILEFFRKRRVHIIFKGSNNFIIDGFTVRRNKIFTRKIDKYIELLYNINLDAPMTLYNSQFEYIVNVGGGIDHQSSPMESEECKALATLSPQEVFDWVFGNSFFVTNNDYDDIYDF